MSQDSEDIPNGPSDSPLWGIIYWMKDNSKDCERLVMSKDEYTVGRVSGCDLILNQTNCSVKIENLSRVHFTIKRVPNIITGYQVVLQDLSSNGTFVNGEKIGKNLSRALCHGDEIGLTCKLQRVSFVTDFFQLKICLNKSLFFRASCSWIHCTSRRVFLRILTTNIQLSRHSVKGK